MPKGIPLFASPTTRLHVISIAVSLALSACSTLETDTIEYKTASKGVALEVPPDLTQLARDNRYQIPGGTVTATGEKSVNATVIPTAALKMGDVRIERSGNQRWLVVQRSPEALWPVLKDFWQDNGFLLAIDEQNLGIMETDWAENRAKLPQDLIRSSIGKLFDQLYSTGERDKFRTRLERLPSGETEVYISHRGLIEKLSGTGGSTQGSTTIWESRLADPELEAEFLRRMMVRLGISNEQSKVVVATTKQVRPELKVETMAGHAVLRIPEGIEVAWRRVGLALDRTGFTVEDRARSDGIYFVRYAPPNLETKEPGFFSKLFGATTTDNKVVKYRIKVDTDGTTSTVKVLNESGTPAALTDAQKILSLITQDLR